MPYVVLERSFDPPVTADKVRAGVAAAGWCMDLHRVRRVESYLSADGRRMICLFEAPDAEAVRQVLAQFGSPYERVWSATVHEAAPEAPAS
jgi:hypothetical protein